MRIAALLGCLLLCCAPLHAETWNWDWSGLDENCLQEEFGYFTIAPTMTDGINLWPMAPIDVSTASWADDLPDPGPGAAWLLDFEVVDAAGNVSVGVGLCP